MSNFSNRPNHDFGTHFFIVYAIPCCGYGEYGYMREHLNQHHRSNWPELTNVGLKVCGLDLVHGLITYAK